MTAAPQLYGQRVQRNAAAAFPGIKEDAAVSCALYVETAADAEHLARKALDSLRENHAPATPHNYTLWYEYHAGYNPDLRRTMDVLLSNGATLDEQTLHDLHAAFLSSVKEERAVREASLRVQETLVDLIRIADGARIDASNFGDRLTGISSCDFGRSIEQLQDLIQNLLRETQRVAGRSEYAGLRLRESKTKIETLERNLESALRDATMDALTGIANRKSFDATIRRLAGDAMNSGDELSLLMVDVDHFKGINDRWGHLVGDQVLHYVARKLRSAVRGQDYVARYGGEEFAVLLPLTGARSALAVGEKLRASMVREGPPLDTTPPLDPVTISVGVSCYEPGDALADWIRRSDAALYRAKQEGRNRVELG